MKKISIGLIIVLLIVGSVYLFLNNAEQTTETNANDNQNENANTNENEGEDEVMDKFKPDQKLPDGGELSFTLKDARVNNNDRTMKYTIKNEEDHKLTLEFGSSMTYDFYITDGNGQEVYRDSDGKSYMQVITEVTFAQDEEKTFDLKIPDLDPGNYTLTAFLAAKGYHQHETSIDFMVE